MRILIVGDSPLALFVARKIDRRLATLTHVEVIWLTKSQECVYSPSLSEVPKSGFINKNKVLANIEVKPVSVKSVNFKERRVVTNRGVEKYDYLFLDQSPHLDIKSIRSIHRSVAKLVIHLKAAKRQGGNAEGRIVIKGKATASWQIALALRAMTHRDGSLVRVFADFPVSLPSVGNFLRSQGIGPVSGSNLPGLVISPLAPSVDPKKIRGANLDKQNRLMSAANGQPLGYDNVLVVDSRYRNIQNIWRDDQSIAGLISHNLAQMVEGGGQEDMRPLPLTHSAILLTSGNSALTVIGGTSSVGVRSRAVRSLDNSLFRRILRA